MNPKKDLTSFTVVGGLNYENCFTLSGSGPIWGGFIPEGSRTTLNPETILQGLPAKHLDILQVHPNSMASCAAIFSLESRSFIETAWMYMSSTCFKR